MKSKVKFISGLKDWNRDYDKLIPKGTAAAKSMNGVIPEEMGLYIDDKGYYHTSGYVGVGWLRDYQGKNITAPITGEKIAVMISPRFSSMNPWEMLIKVMNDPEYELYTSGTNGDFFEIYTGEDLIPVPNTESGGELLAAISFVKECEKICKKHLRQAMDFREDNFNGKVVGNIQVAKHIKQNITQGREDRIYCRYPVFTVDTLENRVMKAALAKAKRIFKKNGITVKEIGRIYSYCENALKAVRLVGISKSDFNRTNITGFNSYYKNVLELAKTVLLGNGVNDLFSEETDDIKYVIPYTINMESLFEFYVRATLKEYLRRDTGSNIVLDEYRMPQKNPLLTLKDSDHRAYLMNNYVPDIALIDREGGENKYIAVFDVKYQNSTNVVYSETRRHNSHQLLFYTLLLNVTRCGFIFPKPKTDEDLGDLEMYELNIQTGDAMDPSEREYTQWSAEFTSKQNDGLAKRIMHYVQGISAMARSEENDG